MLHCYHSPWCEEDRCCCEQYDKLIKRKKIIMKNCFDIIGKIILFLAITGSAYIIANANTNPEYAGIWFIIGIIYGAILR